MGMTIAEKILASHSHLEKVKPGDYVTAVVDRVCINDPFPKIHRSMQAAGIPGGLSGVWDKDRVVVGIDHSAPAMDRNVEVAKRHIDCRVLTNKLGISQFYDVRGGICHQIMVEKGFVLPGTLVLAADSHATIYGALNCAGTGIGEAEMAWVLQFGELWFRVPETIKIVVSGELIEGVTAKDIFLYLSGQHGTEVTQYKAIEWTGSTMDTLSLDGRLSLATHSVDIGAKFGFFSVDAKTSDFLQKRSAEGFDSVESDADANFEWISEIDASRLQPLVAEPHSMEVVNPAALYRDVKIDQAVIGACTNGRLEDIKWAAIILKGKRVNQNVRFLVSPASWEVYKAAMKAGYFESLIDAGAILCHPHCGVCIGKIGVLGPGEVCITATSRNFKGRMGSPESLIYLASPATVAASALTGRITDPREVIH